MAANLNRVRKLLAEAKSDNIASIGPGQMITLSKPKKTHPNMLTGNCKELYRVMKNKSWRSTFAIVAWTGITCVSQEFQRLRDHGYPYVCKRVDGHYEYRMV